LAALTLTPLLFFLPKATLAATIIVAVLSLVDMGALKRTWNFSRSDFFAMLATILLTLAEGVELGIIAGVGLSILLHLYRTSKPHSAIVGRVPGTEHFRNIDRHHVETDNHILTLRVDESLYFANARYLEDRVYDLVMSNPNIEHLILMCPAVNFIDASALESLEAINHRLNDSGVTLNLSEVKGPIMDRLRRTYFVDELTGHIFLSQYEAWNTLRSERVARSVGDL
jgi:SulP family sulfate permease